MAKARLVAEAHRLKVLIAEIEGRLRPMRSHLDEIEHEIAVMDNAAARREP